MKPETETVRIITNNGWREAQCVGIYGNFAVTPFFWMDVQKRGKWSVTHLPTGRKITADRELTAADARKIARRLNAELDFAVWATTEPELVTGCPDQKRLANKIIREVYP